MTTMMQLKPTITLELDGQEAAIIGSALLEQAHRCRDETRARLNRLIASKVYEARRRHHEAAGAVLESKYQIGGIIHAHLHHDRRQ
jgi:hypothetical protein